jgi:hypothetical protein
VVLFNVLIVDYLHSFIYLLYVSSFLQAFPEALFHQLLPAMVHPDHETRVGAHRIFSVVLVPSSVSPCPSSTNKGSDLSRTLSRNVSVFSSSAALFDKLRRDKTSTRENVFQDSKNNAHEGEQISNGMLARLKSSTSRVYSMKNPLVPSTSDENPVNNLNKETVSSGNVNFLSSKL